MLDGTAGVAANEATGSGIAVSNGIILAVDTSSCLQRLITGKRWRDRRVFSVPDRIGASAEPKLLSRNILFNSKLEEADLSHKFVVGQTVHFAPSRGRDAIAGNYLVCHLMPASDYQDEPRYRIKNVAEQHERVVTESELKLRQ